MRPINHGRRKLPDLPDSWKTVLGDELQRPYFEAVEHFVAEELALGGMVFGPRVATEFDSRRSRHTHAAFAEQSRRMLEFFWVTEAT